jgi:mono/diheme cytochrome c family protein
VVAIFGVCCVAWLLDSCATSSPCSIPTAAQIVSVGAADVSKIPELTRGRVIYASSCTECHVARPIAKFSAEEWRRNIDIMAPRAGLSTADRDALEKYVLSARRILLSAQ